MALFTIALVALFIFAIYMGTLFYVSRQWERLEETVSVPAGNHLSFSILMPFRNEANHLGKSLASLLQQKYPAQNFEIICIDDHSSDQSADIVQALAQKHKQVKYLACPEGITGKKQAIELGFRLTNATNCITVDADTWVEPHWLGTYNSLFQQSDADVIAGPVLMHPDPSNSFHYFQVIDYCTVQAISMIGIKRRWFYNASGANMAFTRDIYNDFLDRKHGQHLATGDDAFLLESATSNGKGDILFPKNKALVSYTNPEKNWSDFLRQRQRWASKSFQYHNKLLPVIWGFVWLVNLNLLLLPLAALFFGKILWATWGIVLILKILADYVLIQRVTNYFDKSYLKHFLLSQLYHIFYVVTIGFITMTATSYRWKDKKISTSGKF